MRLEKTNKADFCIYWQYGYVLDLRATSCTLESINSSENTVSLNSFEGAQLLGLNTMVHGKIGCEFKFCNEHDAKFEMAQ